MEMESKINSTKYENFVDQVSCLGAEVNSSDPINNDTIFSNYVVLKMTCGNYVTNGVGPTADIARMDAMIKICSLMSQQLGFTKPYRHTLPIDRQNTDDFLRDTEHVLDLACFLQKHESFLKLTRHFIADDDHEKQSISTMTRLQKVIDTLDSCPVSYENVCKYNTYISRCTYAGYCSTGLGLSIQEANSHAAGEMLYLLKQICGFVLIRDETNVDCNRSAIGSLSLRLPVSFGFKLKVMKYFLNTPHQKVSSENELREIAALTDEHLECRVERSDTCLQVQYSTSYCGASATAVDETTCRHLCCTEMILKFHKWCGFNLTNKYEDVEKYYALSCRNTVDDERYQKPGKAMAVKQILVDDNENKDESKMNEKVKKIIESVEVDKVDDGVELTKNENVDVSSQVSDEFDHRKFVWWCEKDDEEEALRRNKIIKVTEELEEKNICSYQNVVNDDEKKDTLKITEKTEKIVESIAIDDVEPIKNENLDVSTQVSDEYDHRKFVWWIEEDDKKEALRKNRTTEVTDRVEEKIVGSDETMSTTLQDTVAIEKLSKVDDNPANHDQISNERSPDEENDNFEKSLIRCTHAEIQSVFCHTKYITLRQGEPIPSHVRYLIRKTVPAVKKAEEPLKIKLCPAPLWRRNCTFAHKTQDRKQTKIDKLVRKATEILNKITPDSFLYFSAELFAVFVNSMSTSNYCFEIILDLLLKKAVNEPIFTSLYAKLCYTIFMRAMQDTSVHRPEEFCSMLSLKLLEKCYERLDFAFAEFKKLSNNKMLVDSGPHYNTHYELALKLQENETACCLHAIDVCRFIGELHLTRYYSPEVIMTYMKKLYKTRNDLSLQSLCTLLSIVEPSMKKTSNWITLNAYTRMIHNLEQLVMQKDPAVLLLSKKTKMEINNFLATRNNRSESKSSGSDGPKCINEKDEYVIGLFGVTRPSSPGQERRPNEQSSTETEAPKTDQNDQRDDDQQQKPTGSRQPATVAEQSNSSIVNGDNDATTTSCQVNDQEAVITRPLSENILPRISEKRFPRGTEPGLDTTQIPTQHRQKTNIYNRTPAAVHQLQQRSVSGQRCDNNYQQTRDKLLRQERVDARYERNSNNFENGRPLGYQWNPAYTSGHDTRRNVHQGLNRPLYWNPNINGAPHNGWIQYSNSRFDNYNNVRRDTGRQVFIPYLPPQPVRLQPTTIFRQNYRTHCELSDLNDI